VTQKAPKPPLRVLWNDEPTTGLNLLQKGLQEALLEQGVQAAHLQRSQWMRRVARVVAKAGLVRPLPGRRRYRSIVAIAWASELTLFPAGYFDEIVPFIFDCWPEQFDAWARLLRKHNITLAFFSARDAAAALQSRVPGLVAHWLPEACNISLFDASRPLKDRSLHILEMGRKHPELHAKLLGLFPQEHIARHNITHVYSKVDSSTPIYPTLTSLYEAMGNTLVSVCFPKSVTHNHSTDRKDSRVETLTQRYLETIGNGALPLGACPAELKDLFGFDPVIPVDLKNLAAQIREIVRNPESYQHFADKARVRLAEVGTFAARGKLMLQTLQDAS
jgi:hypothetical protein